MKGEWHKNNWKGERQASKGKRKNTEGKKGGYNKVRENSTQSKGETKERLSYRGKGEEEREKGGSEITNTLRKTDNTKGAYREKGRWESRRTSPIVITCPPWKESGQEREVQGKRWEGKRMEPNQRNQRQQRQEKREEKWDEKEQRPEEQKNTKQRRRSRSRGNNKRSESRRSSREQTEYNNRRRTSSGLGNSWREI